MTTSSGLLNRLLARGKFRHLQVLLQLAELGSVQRTAEAIGMTQSSVTQTLAYLEQLLDIRLFDRHARGVRPTPACTDLLPVARQLMLGLHSGAEVLAARMTPVGEVFERFPRLVRDLARDLGKRIRFDAEGEEIELDRSVLDEVGEPLLHLIRNAADHGIERPEVRAAEGKLELIEPGKLIVATDSTFAPFSMRTPSGELDGLEVRVMREVCRRLGLEYSPVNIKFDALLVGLMADQYDITSESMDITPARQKQVAFADGWLESGARIVTRKDTGIKGPDDLKGRNVGALSASTFGKLAEEHGATLKSYKTAADAMQDLVGGNIDAVINDAVAGNYAIKARKLPLVMIETPLSTVQKGFAIKKGKPNLHAAVNKALAEMVADGTYAKLVTPLIGYDPAPKEPIRTPAM